MSKKFAGENVTADGRKYVLRPADENDYVGITELFSSHDHGLKHIEWVRWKYSDNPFGKARLFVAVDSGGEIIAVISYLPRDIRSEKTGTISACLATTGLCSEKWRGKGIYKKLSAYTKETINSATLAFPNKRSIGISRVVGRRIVAPFTMWRYPISFSAKSNGRKGLASSAADTLLRAYAYLFLGRTSSDLTMKPIERFDRDFEVDTSSIHGVRTADFLNWRFVDNPMYEYSIHGFFEGGEMIGYCAYLVKDDTAEIFDLLSPRRRRQCFGLLLEHCRKEGLRTAKLRGVGLDLRKYGFIPRSTRKNFVVNDVPEGSWMVTLCDDY
jgi:hypothetical protein